eukprot:TRINITY_DN6919_c0_g1_i2.p1 TRINITY_DN6919_c0_g1~~TRINITY_DN6919_c0_g1_i2.p1  ORF type:complete len:471 (-),score=33.70 TRINITY_DN6919_c0_g1_i2:661-2025(-)
MFNTVVFRQQSIHWCFNRKSPASKAVQRDFVTCNTAVLQSQVAWTEKIRVEFPILQQKVNGKDLIYFDNAATSQKPLVVLDAIKDYYTQYNSNVHRGVHHLSTAATFKYEEAREKIASFVNANSAKEIVFCRNASEAINLIAYSWALPNFGPKDEIICSVAEHHSNIVPWQMISQKTGCKLKFVGLAPNQQELDINQLESLVTDNTKLISLVHVSNMLGAITNINKVMEVIRGKQDIKLLLDCCQSVPHMPVDVNTLGADWIVASGHKMCGPTGVGFLWGKYSILEQMQPFMGGGEMIQDVFLEQSTYADPPARFEAGTPAIGESIALGVACDYLMQFGMDKIQAHEKEIGKYLYDKMSQLEGIEIYGPDPHVKERAALCSFNVKGIHATDISTILDNDGVAVRSGHHCTQPLHRALGINASARASLYIYNNKQEVDRFVELLQNAIQFFKQFN